MKRLAADWQGLCYRGGGGAHDVTAHVNVCGLCLTGVRGPRGETLQLLLYLWSMRQGEPALGTLRPGCSHIVMLHWWLPLPGGREAFCSDLTDVCLKEQRAGTDIAAAPLTLEAPSPLFGDFRYPAQQGCTVAMLIHPDESTGMRAQMH